jgi:DNA polymerase/3'-5' exonuclease PolX
MNEQLANHLQEIALAYASLKEQWKSRAFFKAAASVRKVKLQFKNGALVSKVPGAGEAITTVIEQFNARGTSEKLERLQGERKAKGVALKEVERLPAKEVRPIIDRILKPLRAMGYDVGYAGSMRRGKETVKDVDVIACVKDEEEKAAIRAQLEEWGLEANVRSGDKKLGIPVAIGKKSITLDFNFCESSNRGAYYLYFTGSKEFVIAMRSQAKKRGLHVNEYGVFRGKEKLAGETEEGMFKALNFKYVEPKERELVNLEVL